MKEAVIKQVENGFIVEHAKVIGGKQYFSGDTVTMIFATFNDVTNYLESLFYVFKEREQ